MRCTVTFQYKTPFENCFRVGNRCMFKRKIAHYSCNGCNSHRKLCNAFKSYHFPRLLQICYSRMLSNIGTLECLRFLLICASSTQVTLIKMSCPSCVTCCSYSLAFGLPFKCTFQAPSVHLA